MEDGTSAEQDPVLGDLWSGDLYKKISGHTNSTVREIYTRADPSLYPSKRKQSPATPDQ
jgi:hypothetical protein